MYVGKNYITENRTKSRHRFESLMMLITGMFSCTNVVSAFVVGSTSIAWMNVLTVLFLFFCIVLNKGKLKNVIHYFTRDLLFTGFFIFLSVVQVILFNPNNLYQWAVGCVAVALNGLIIVFILEEKEYKNLLYSGLIIGIAINFAVSIYAMVLYNRGVILDLASYFPNTSGISRMYLSNSFRARGLFKEQGHLMRYIAIIALPVIAFAKKSNRILYYCTVGMVIFLAAFSGSSALAIFLLGVAVYIILVNGKTAWRMFGFLILIICGVSLVLVLGRNIPFFQRLTVAFRIGVLSIFDTESANADRLQGMKYAIEIIKEYPIIGCGWNQFTKIFMDKGFYGDQIFGSYSAGLSLIAEIGFASLCYFFFCVKKAFELIRSRMDEESIAVGVSLLIYLLLFFTTDFSFDSGSSTFIALSLIVYTDTKDNINNLENEGSNDYN